MGWELNRLLKTTGITYIPGSPAIPGSAGTAGSPAYTYWADVVVPGATYSSPLPPSGWDTETILTLPGGSTQTLRSGGHRFFNGVKAYLTAVIAGIEYIYVAESQTVRTEVFVPAVAPTPPTAPVPATAAQLIEDYNLGWNSGALGPATLAVNTVFTWRMSAGNVGSVVGLSLTTAPQDYGYIGMSLSVLAQSGLYQVYRGGAPLGTSAPFTDNTRFALSRTNTGDVEVYVNGGLVHTEELAADVVVDCSLFSGGDLIWDAQELTVAVAPLNNNIAAVTVSDAQALASAIAVTRTFGPGTAMGVAGATTVSRAINGQVKVDGAVYVNIGETSDEGGTGGGKTLTAAVGVAGAINVSQAFGPDTAKGLAGAVTASDAVAAGDTATGVGISTNSGSGDLVMLPLAGAGSGPNVAVGWTGNYVGDAMRLQPLTVSAAGGLVVPTLGIATLVLAPMDGDVGGATGEISTSSSGSMLPMRAFASSETEYSYGYVSFPPLTGGGTNRVLSAELALQVIIDYANDNTNPTPTVRDYIDAGVTGVDESNIVDVNAAVDALTGSDVDTPEKIQAIVDALNAELANVLEGLFLTSETQSLYNLPILERLRNIDTANTFYQPQAEITDTTRITDPLQVVLVLTVAEALEVADPVEVIQVAQLLESLGAADAIELTLQALAVVEDAVNTGDSLYAAVTRSALDTVNTIDTVNALVRFLSQLADALTVTDTLEINRLVLVELLDSTTVDDTFELTAQYVQEMLSEMRVYALLTSSADVSQGWAMNTEEDRPVSEYDNFNFTSLAWYQGQLWGTLDDGLYLLEGDDDAGTPIQAEIASLLLDFATSRQKTVRTVYLGYTATGKLVLKVRSVDNGKMTEKWYSAKQRVADAPREGVMQPGRGLRSRYWQFELANVDGADFDIDHLELYPVILSRRV